MNRRGLVVLCVAVLAFVLLPAAAWARRSGGSFGGRTGFRSSGSSSYSRSYARTPRAGGGTNFVVLPGFGWGWGMGGMGYGGGGLFSSLLMLGVLGFGAVMVLRAFRRSQGGHPGAGWNDDDESEAAFDRAFVYKVQFGLGRSGRGIQERLETFAAEGDTSSGAGLAQLLSQTAVELLREKHSIRYAAVEANGPMSFTNGETKMNAAALAERSRFQVERIRSAEGKVRRSETASVESNEALEYLVVTLVLATRASLAQVRPLTSGGESVDDLLGALGAVPPEQLLGLEVIWTPADPQDSMTEADLLTTYPEMTSL